MSKREKWIKPTYGFAGMGEILPQLSDAAFKKKAKAESEILTRWPVIVGSDIAGKTLPRKISFARNNEKTVLVLDVSNSDALEIQHMEPVILEKISSYFGFRIIEKIKLVQGKDKAIKEEKTVAVDECDDIDMVQEINVPLIKDDELQAALRKLKKSLVKKNKE